MLGRESLKGFGAGVGVMLSAVYLRKIKQKASALL